MEDNLDNLLNVKQLFFNNLQLMGFNVAEMEATNHIPFNKNMFELPNKRGAEIVLHFLFERLNPTMCREAFRDIWPILDKKREAAFRKTCANWLSNIAKEDPDAHLPRINASLFMSPGGEKFYQLLLFFSGYALQKMLENQYGSKAPSRPKYPSLTPQNLQHADVMMKALLCDAIRHRKNYFDNAQLTLKAGKIWKEAADEHVKEHRKLNKEIRELDYQIREEEQKALENSLTRGSPTKRQGRLDNLDPNFDPRTIQRAQRVQCVRDMWKQLDDFERTEAAEREIIESIVERTLNKCKIDKIDAAEIHVKVPDMLLRECGEEIRRRNVSNTYEGGKLNLESVIQLWNLCLKLYLEKLKQVGMPKFDEDVKVLTSQVHIQHNYLQNAKTLRNQMSEKVPVLKESIEKLRQRLDTAMFKDESPSSIRTTSLGIGLVEPSPEVNFSPRAAATPTNPIMVPRSNMFVDTPTAADQLIEEMKSTVQPKQLFTVEMDQLTQYGKKESAIPKPGPAKVSSQASSRQSSRPNSARSTASSKASRKTNQSTDKQTTPRDRETTFPKVSSPKTMVETVGQFDGEKLDLSLDSVRSVESSHKTLSARSNKSGGSSSTAKASQSPRSVKSGSSGRLSDRSHDSRSHDSRSHDGEVTMTSQQSERKTAVDLLVDEIMGEGVITSPLNSGMEAFESRNLINRTPDIDDQDIDQDENKENIEPDERTIHHLNANYNNNVNVDDNVDDERVVVGEELNANDQADPDIVSGVDNYLNADRFKDLVENEEVDLDKIEFEDIMGPELDADYDDDDDDNNDDDDGRGSEGSQRSQEQVIVIDRSLHLSPRHVTSLQTHGTAYNLDDERFPSAETSPRAPIVIDHSFHGTPTDKGQENQNHSNNSPGSLSRSFQGRTVDPDQVRKDLLSKSLILERSPLSDEIRQMFQKAAAETPPRAQSLSFTSERQTGEGSRERRQIGSEDELELPNMDINSRQNDPSVVVKKADISWEGTDNIDDIEMPDFDGADEFLKHTEETGEKFAEINEFEKDQNTEKTQKSPEFVIPGFREIEGMDHDVNTDNMPDFKIPGVHEIDDIDDFFKSKTPELPSRFQGKVNQSLEGDGDNVIYTDSFEMPKFPEKSSELEDQDQDKLILFTP